MNLLPFLSLPYFLLKVFQIFPGCTEANLFIRKWQSAVSTHFWVWQIAPKIFPLLRGLYILSFSGDIPSFSGALTQIYQV